MTVFTEAYDASCILSPKTPDELERIKLITSYFYYVAAGESCMLS